MGFEPMMATELEFYIFENACENLHDGWPKDLRPILGYNEDHHLFRTTKDEGLMRAVRNGLYGAGIAVENPKGEADSGQLEVNYKYSDALDTAGFRVCGEHTKAVRVECRIPTFDVPPPISPAPPCRLQGWTGSRERWIWRRN